VQKNIIKRAQVQLADVEIQRPPATTTDAAVHRVTKKRAVLVEEEGRPAAIEVTCACGEVTLVELEFGANGEKSS
jgi:hypothetical protein